MHPDIGAPAPGFDLPTDSQSRGGAGQLSLSQLRGRPVVLYFYPKDNTSGCTKEAESFRDLYPAFQALGAEIVGVSKDSVKKHDAFRDKVGIPYPLVSDAEGTLCEDYGVWVEKSMYGRTYLGIERATFLIDGTGALRQVWRKVKVTGHAEAVLEAVRGL
jgi:peroxiredoxin